ncbi:MAG: PrsW family intramembrane metalloprotease [Erysipelotrichia bacterium]|nr:PrsW family intramembrane metalloprotease [Erysipelotrichia bacterium]
MFVVGGITSILLVYWMRDYVGYPTVVFLEDLLTGLVEETAKLLIVLIFLRTFKVKHMITGMLIGFAVGAGFDVFETANYGMIEFMMNFDFFEMQSVMATRALFSLIGVGHHFWTSMLVGALVFFNQKKKVGVTSMFNLNFGLWFLLIVLLHTLNNYLDKTFTPLLSNTPF